MLKKIKESVNYINKNFSQQSSVAVILGSGLSDFTREVEVICELDYSDIPHFPESHIPGHRGSLILSLYNKVPVVIMNGRVHYYEGYSMDQVTYPVRVMKFLGIENLLLSNAAGGMNPEFNTGDLMLITDHIHLMPNPLIGKHIARFGARFPDMSEAYNPALNQLAVQTAAELDLELKEGIYIGVTGPTYETPAEYNYFRIIGGDAIGMSTTPEVIVAHQMGMKCMAVSVITDLGVPGKMEKLDHKKVQQEAREAEPRLAMIIKRVIEKVK
jgi:purine-nucleoside phosphorylase